MKTVAALYDIHGNLAALDAVLAEVRAAGVTQIVVGGDVLPGPMPRECMDRLLSLDIPTQFIMGNGDREVLAVMRGQEPTTVPEQFREGIRTCAAALGPEHARAIAAWPPTVELKIDGVGKVLFCHATPRNDVEIFNQDTMEEVVSPMFEGVHADLVVCGHTHVQFERTVWGVRVVNAGSVGMPFDGTGARWLLIGPAVSFRTTKC